jgi:hexosaminidase
MRPKQQFHIILIIAFMILSSMEAFPKSSIIPEPVLTESRRGNFRLSGDIELFIPANDEMVNQHATALLEYLSGFQGVKLSIKSYPVGSPLPSNGIVLAIDGNGGKPEGYTLDVSSKRILITGDDISGLFYGIQSLRQLLPVELEDAKKAKALSSVKIPAVYIRDYPLFSYRGMHLDVARHFFDVDFVKRYIDLMAMHKFNTFHWHLTEDQGWRIEIKKYPRLTEIGAWRKETLIGHGARPPFEYDGIPYGGFYTQDQIKEVVAYAAARHVTVIPEIELPGHAIAALAAYPELGCTGGPYEVVTRWGIFEDAFCAGNEVTFEFFENVLSEVVELFPSQYIHIGGDECLKNRWKECPKCQERKATEGLADEHELQSYFIHRIEEFLLTKNRNIIGWDEILEGGLAPNATVMSWRGLQGGIEAARMGHDVIMTPVNYCYFDYYQADPETQPLAIGGYLTLKQVYSFNPIPAELNETEAKHVLGGQANVWTEYIKTPEHAEYMVFPRAVALSEILWSPRSKQDFDDFSSRLDVHKKRLDVLNVNYFK